MTTSLLLDQKTWDLTTDINGNIALASEPYSTAQDVACALRTFLGEPYFDTSQGVKYLQLILGKFSPLSVIKAELTRVALDVTGVVSAVAYVTTLVNRNLVGQVQVTLESGVIATIALNATPGGASAFILGYSNLGGGNVI